MKQILKKFLQKGFEINLEDKYAYPNYKEFVMADALVMQAAIENYCIKNDCAIEYISKEKPISFILNGKDKYSAKLEMGCGRANQGYHIHCLEIVE